MSIRKAKRQLDQWDRYFSHYQPWHDATPGMIRAYNRLVCAMNAS